jgi:predicted GNAT family N-acyltransferase
MDPSAPIRLELSRTESVGRDRLDAIIALKSQHWPYPYESQARWFADNVAPSDQHLLAWRKDALIGYLRTIEAEGMQGGVATPLTLVDTVCIDRKEQGKGFGAVLMHAANHAIRQVGRSGLLACSAGLKGFYLRCEWTLFSSSVEAAAEVAGLLPAGSAFLIFDPTRRIAAAPLRVSAPGTHSSARNRVHPSATGS